jgi:hypothetical protein
MSRILLKTEDHSRDSAGMRYVYPVVSRRAGGVSVGINLNPNNACNWRCIYCQVPGLTRGGPPPIDLACWSANWTASWSGDGVGRFHGDPRSGGCAPVGRRGVLRQWRADQRRRVSRRGGLDRRAGVAAHGWPGRAACA